MGEQSTSLSGRIEQEIQRRLLGAKQPAAGLIGRSAGRAPLAPVQRGLWILHQFDPSSPVSNRPFALNLEGPLQPHILRRALEAILERHQILRAAFLSEDGGPVQLIQPNLGLPWDEQTLEHLPPESRDEEACRLLRQRALVPFDLTRGPLLRALLLRLHPHRHVLGLFTHHIVFDGWSERVFLRELKALYAAFSEGAPSPLDDLPVQYTDYAAWQAERMARGDLQSQIDYWRNQLAAPPEPLTIGRRTSSPHSEMCSTTVPEDLVRNLRELALSQRATLFMVLFSAWQLLLARYGGQSDILTGVPAAGRIRTELEPLIGCLMTVLLLRTRLGESDTVLELLASVRQTALESFARQEIPLETVAEFFPTPRQTGHWGFFPSMFQLRNLPDSGATESAGVRFQAFHFDPGVLGGVDLSLEARQAGDELHCDLRYRVDAFDPWFARQILAHFRNLLQAFVNHPNQSIWTLPLLAPEERQRIVVGWNSATAAFPAGVCVHHLFESQADRHPEAVAAVFEDASLTYGELERRSNQLARRLMALGAGPDQVVALLLDKSLQALVGILGILKSGAAYLPIDPHLPEARVRHLLDDAQALAVVIDPGSPRLAAVSSVPTVELDAAFAQIRQESEARPAAQVLPENLAYVIYTSGSTGQPKGVAVEHRHVVGFLHSFRPLEGLAEHRIGTNIASLAFDASVEEIFSCLCFGGTVHLLRPERVIDAVYFARYLREHRINCADVNPDMLEPVAHRLSQLGGAPHFRCLITGLAPKAQRCLQAWRNLCPHLRIVNGYGPTEVTYGATAFEFHQADNPDAEVPIGRPFPNYTVYLLDQHMQPVPPGVTGELYIGGPCVARGYLRQPELTRERFLPDLFSPSPAARLYRTGDLGRFLPDGNIEFLGRADRQIKLRGYRIELDEIESAIKSHPEVESAAVAVWEPSAGDKAIAAYVVFQEGSSKSIAGLRDFLSRRLPSYMIPADWVVLDALPRNTSGKIDSKALPKPRRNLRPAQPEAAGIPTALQARLKSIWAELLGAEDLSLDQDFFEAGGHSLLAVRMFELLDRRLGVRLPPSALLEAPTIRALAALLERQGQNSGWRAVVPLQPRGRRIPLFLAHRHDGQVFLYRGLAARLGEDQPVYGLQSIHLAQPWNRPFTMEEIAAACLEEIRAIQPHGPYCLGGFCFGAYLAFEIARQLQHAGEKVGLLAVINTPGDWRLVRTPADSLRYHWRHIMGSGLRRTPAYLAERVRFRLKSSFDAIVWPLLHSKMEQWSRLPAWIQTSLVRRAHLLAGRRYAGGTFHGRLLSFDGAGESFRDFHTYWNNLVDGEVMHVGIPGRGAGVFEESNVAVLAEKLRLLLDEAQAPAPSAH